MLNVRDLCVSLEEEQTPILRGLNLVVQRGEVHAIMGPNGSGKSTLSYVLAGREGYEITSGSVELDGTDLLEMEPEERARRRSVSCVPESDRTSRSQQHGLPAHRAECAAARARRG